MKLQEDEENYKMRSSPLNIITVMA